MKCRTSDIFFLPLRASAASCLCAIFLLGCADPAPTPPPPQVSGLDSYIAGAKAIQAGQNDQAQQLLGQAVAQNPDLTVAHQMLGDLYRKESDYRRASEQYNAFVRLDPYNYRSHYDLGLTYQVLTRFQEAMTAYGQALALSPRDLKSNMNLGLVYLSLGRTDEAIRQLQLAVAIDPDNADAQLNLGVALETIGRLGKAEACYRRAMELDPSSTLAMIDLGSNLVRQHRGHEAAEVLEAAVKRVSTPQVHKRLGDALLLDHRDEDALAEYDAALQLDGRYWPAMNQVGLIELRKYQAGLTLDEGLRQSAIAMWKQSLALDEDQPRIRELVDKWTQNGRLTP